MISSRFVWFLASISVGFGDESKHWLVAHYSFDGNTKNEAGPSNTNVEDFIVYDATPTTDLHGVSDCAYYFNGNSYLVTQTASFLPTKNRTISIWFNTNNVSNGRYVLGYGGEGGCGTSEIHLLNNQDAPNSYDIQGHCRVNRVAYYWDENTNPLNNGWTMWTFTSDSINGSKMYVNDTLVSWEESVIFDNTNVDNSYLVLGAGIGSDGETYPHVGGSSTNVMFDGKLDELNIYNQSLTQFEISAMFEDFVATPTSTPTFVPSMVPSIMPTIIPTVVPSTLPTILSNPTSMPLMIPTDFPSYFPTISANVETTNLDTTQYNSSVDSTSVTTRI